MLTRICLVIAIVAGLAALGISQFKTDKKIKLITSERDTYLTERDQERENVRMAKEETAKTKEELDKTSAELTTTKTELTAAAAKAEEQENRAKKAVADLSKVNQEKNQAQQKLAQYEPFGTPDAVKNIVASNKLLQEERDAIEEEKKILTRKLRKVENELASYRDEEESKVELPVGLRGRVVSVDPKYDFVVLDIGGNQGVLERGEMMVARNGKLVGKVRIISVEANRSVANILPNWKQLEPFEGDEVIY